MDTALSQPYCPRDTWHEYHPNATFGGYKMSGYEREQGAEALESYTQYKTR